MIGRLLFLLTCGAVFAGIVHIVIILMIPFLGERDAARKIMAQTPYMQFRDLDGDLKEAISGSDPYFNMAVCRFDVGENGVYVFADKTPEFWSASVYNARGSVVYSMNDRTAIANQLRVLIVNPVQMAALRQLQPEELETSIVVETSAQRGFILIRSFRRDPSLENVSKAFLQSANCEEYQALG